MGLIDKNKFEKDILRIDNIRKAVVEDIKDPSGNNRVKVRISGVHTSDKNALPTEKLPWVDVKPEIGAGGGKGQTANLHIGQIVDVRPTNISETVFEVVGMSNILPNLTGDNRNFGSIAEGDDKRIGKFLAPLLASGDLAKLALTTYKSAMNGIFKYISAWISDDNGELILPPQLPPKNVTDGFAEQMTVKCDDVDLSNDPVFQINPANDTEILVQDILDYPSIVRPGLSIATAEGLPDPYDPNSLVPPGETQIGPISINANDYILQIYSNQRYLRAIEWEPGYTPIGTPPNNLDPEDYKHIVEIKKAEVRGDKLFIPAGVESGIYTLIMILKRKYPNNQKLSFKMSLKVLGPGEDDIKISDEKEPDYEKYPKNVSGEQYSIDIPYDSIRRPGNDLSTFNNSIILSGISTTLSTLPNINDYLEWPSVESPVREVNILEPELTNEYAKSWYCNVKDNGRISIVSDATKGNETYAIYHTTKPAPSEGKDNSAVEAEREKETEVPVTDPNAKKERPDVTRFEMNPKGELIQKSSGDMFLISSENLNIMVENIVQQKVKQLWTLHCPVVQIKGDVRIDGKLIVSDGIVSYENIDAGGEVTANSTEAPKVGNIAPPTTLSGHLHPSEGAPPIPGT